MPTATMTSKGQTVIPKPVRDYLGLHAGDLVDFVIQDEHTVLLKPSSLDVTRLKGLLRRPGRKAVSVEAMNRVIAKRAGKMP